MRVYVVAAVAFVSDAGAPDRSSPRPPASATSTSAATCRTATEARSATWSWPLALFFLAGWIAFVWRQVSAWRSASGVQRAQLKWLATGSAICVVSAIVIVMFGDGHTTGARVAADLGTVGIGVLPVAIGVGDPPLPPLRDRPVIVSRTLAYAVLTALLVGTFAGIVLLTTRVLPFSSPVAVAASTLAAAALFNPLRTRVQRLVDRRFNRARYDREALVAAFGAKLRDAVDSETVLAELAGAASKRGRAGARLRLGRLRSSPLDELPDLRLGGGVLADLGEGRDGGLETRHRLVVAAERAEEIGGVVLERRLAVAVADRDAERERLLGQRERAVELALGAQREREVVERGGAGDGVVLLGREREAPLELCARLGVRAAAGGEDAEDVERLRERARVVGLLGERQRLLCERLGLVVAASAVRVEAAVGDDARRERRGRVGAERVLERALRELPLAAPLVEEADPVLDRAEPLGGGERRGGLVAVERGGRSRRRASRDPRSPRGAKPDRRRRARALRGRRASASAFA